MNPNTATEETTIELTRVYRAPRARVWAAFTEPEQLKRWYAPVAGWTIPVCEVDLRVGGTYEIHLQPPGRDAYVERGTYVEIVPEQRLVVDLGIAGEQTTLTVELLDAEEGTEVRVTETGYSSREIRDRHLGGWTTMLSQLEQQLEQQLA
ncbi:MAG TPA: SRPBCC domain-containing protein [Actinomycetota bacterium]|jgi:uncharacterized protein YndB with AHSA1/START domain